jgi:hypothetical protein
MDLHLKGCQQFDGSLSRKSGIDCGQKSAAPTLCREGLSALLRACTPYLDLAFAPAGVTPGRKRAIVTYSVFFSALAFATLAAGSPR